MGSAAPEIELVALRKKPGLDGTGRPTSAA
jgi:hypothetical protein